MLSFRKIRKAEVLVARLFLKVRVVESHVETKNSGFLSFKLYIYRAFDLS